MEHTEAAQIAAVVGALGAVLVILMRGRVGPLVGFALLGIATAFVSRSLIGDRDLELLLTEPTGLALVGVGALAALGLAVLL
nr:hypothetical protein [Actinomycetota bacterium]